MARFGAMGEQDISGGLACNYLLGPPGSAS